MDENHAWLVPPHTYIVLDVNTDMMNNRVTLWPVPSMNWVGSDLNRDEDGIVSQVRVAPLTADAVVIASPPAVTRISFCLGR